MKCIIKTHLTFQKKPPESIFYPVIICVRFASISTFAIILKKTFTKCADTGGEGGYKGPGNASVLCLGECA